MAEPDVMMLAALQGEAVGVADRVLHLLTREASCPGVALVALVEALAILAVHVDESRDFEKSKADTLKALALAFDEHAAFAAPCVRELKPCERRS